MIGTKKIGGKYVIVIGGGTSGLMASVAMAGAEVVLLEKNPTLGKKLLLRVERAAS